MSIHLCRWVYPRVCGGTRVTMAILRKKGGLSPRVRGNQYGQSIAGVKRRSIPACAGEPIALARMGIGREVYPRVCGGTATCCAW